MVWLCVTFKFVCFDGMEGKKLVDEVIREKREKKNEREKERELCYSLEEVVGKKEGRSKKEKKRVRVRVWRRKKEGGKKERKRKLYG